MSTEVYFRGFLQGDVVEEELQRNLRVAAEELEKPKRCWAEFYDSALKIWAASSGSSGA